jgi:four helix bundle protein
MALQVYSMALDVVRGVGLVVRQVERRDGDIARQLRRAVSSVPLNIAEAEGLRGGNQRLRFETALGSAREVRACLDVAVAFGYCDDAALEALRDRIDHVVATLFKLARRRS